MDVSISPMSLTYGIATIATVGILYCVNKIIAKENENTFKRAWMLELLLGIILYGITYYQNDISEDSKSSMNILMIFSLIVLFLLFIAGLHLFNTTVSDGKPIVYSIMAMIEIVLAIVIYSFTIYKSVT